jgi:hypothetical protein
MWNNSILRAKTRVAALWTAWKEILVGSVLLSFFLYPLFGVIRDKVYKHFVDPADYYLSVFVCAPIAVAYPEIIDSAGKRHHLRPTFMETPFDIVIRNDGARHLEDNAFLIFLKKDNSHPEVGDDSDLQISNLLAGSRSPLDAYEAELSDKTIRLSAKTMNSGDFIYVGGISSRPLAVEVFSKSVGLTSRDTWGAARCPIFLPVNVGDVFVFFKQKDQPPSSPQQ